MSNLTSQQLDIQLKHFISHIVPEMLRKNYHLFLVKGGKNYPHLSEQSHFSHIVNGAFGLLNLIRFVVEHKITIRNLDDETLRKAIALYVIHEIHKAQNYEKLDRSEFSIPLSRLREEYETLGLSQFVAVSDHEIRYGNVHMRSTRHGDALLGDDGASFLWLLVRIADRMASISSPDEGVKSLVNLLKHLSPDFLPKGTRGKYGLQYHILRDVRGVSTNAIHRAVSHNLAQKYQLFPLQFFATGTLYIGRKITPPDDTTPLLNDITTTTLNALSQFTGDSDAVRHGLRAKNYDFEKFVYTYANVESLLEVVQENLLWSKSVKAGEPLAEIDKLTRRKEFGNEWRESVAVNYGIQFSDPKENKLFNEHWSATYRYLQFVDAILKQVAPSGDNVGVRLEWLLEHFELPQSVAKRLMQETDIWGKGGYAKYVLVVAYHFLSGSVFAERNAETYPLNQVLEKLHQSILEGMAQVDTRQGRQAAVSTLGFRQDLTTYLQEQLQLSIASSLTLKDDGFQAYSSLKKKGHTQGICSLCNRQNEFVQELRTGILDDFGRIFSNRVLPAPFAPGHNRMWCPVCHLEFIFRKLSGLGLPAGAHYKTSYTIYLYVLPNASFTPHHIELYERILGHFIKPTGLPVRDYGKDWGLPRHWLEKRQLDPEWIETVLDILDRETEKIENWGGAAFVGETLSTIDIEEEMHFYPIRWEKAARESESDDGRIATRTEAWAKALFVAAVITGLTSCKLFVTERPFLPYADPTEIKPTILLDSPPPALRSLLDTMITDAHGDYVSLYGREEDKSSGLEAVLDLSAALWTVTTDVHAPKRNTKDKHFANRLSELNVNPLAGAKFYKEYSRLNEGSSPFSPLNIACDVLLQYKGGIWMDLVKEISEKAIAVRLPNFDNGRGKVHNYELAFRESVAALRKGFPLIPELRATALNGKKPSADAISELKTLASGTLQKSMERQAQRQKRKATINPWRGQFLNEGVQALIDLVVDKVYLGRAAGNFAEFLRLENTLADGVYYYTDRNLSAMREKYSQQFQKKNEEEKNI